MGLFFTLLYVLTAYIGPETIFGDLAQYRLQLMIGLVALLASVLGSSGSGVMRLTHPVALTGLMMAACLSLVRESWVGGPLSVAETLFPVMLPFFFVYINCRKKKHLQMLVGVMMFSALFTVLRGHMALRANDMSSPYIYGAGTDPNATDRLLRIKGLAFIADPNDLSQFIVGLIPCLFLFWSKRNALGNLLFVLCPISFLIYGMYLTHSRGGMLALIAIAIVAGRRKIGIVPAVITGVLLFAGFSASGWSGGREVSAASGSDRMTAWSIGLGLIRSRPFFGVGFQRFNEFYEITAHNTVVVCAAEIGIIGFFFWMLFVLPSIRDAISASEDSKNMAIEGGDKDARALSSASGFAVPFKQKKVDHRIATSPFTAPRLPAPLAAPSAQKGVLTGLPGEKDTVSDEEVHRMAGLMVLSFAGFFTAGWFLSRSYIMTMFINGAIAEVIYRMARERGIAPPPLAFPRAMKLSLIACAILLAVVYLILRLGSILGR